MKQMPDLDLEVASSPPTSSCENSSISNLSSPIGSPTGKKIPRKNSSPRTFFESGYYSIDVTKSLGTSPTVTVFAFDAKNPKRNSKSDADKVDTPTPRI